MIKDPVSEDLSVNIEIGSEVGPLSAEESLKKGLVTKVMVI